VEQKRMKKFGQQLLVCSCLWLLSQSVLATCPTEFRMPYNSSWLPYVKVAAAQVSGTDIEFIRAVVTATGSRLKLESLPESRALQYLAAGQVDLLFAASYTPERAQYAWFTVGYRQEKTVLVVHPDLLRKYPPLATAEGFVALASRKLVGAFNPKGYYGELFEQLKQQPQVQQRTLAIFDPTQRLDLVLSQRADFTVVDQTAHRTFIAQHPAYQRLVELPFVLHQADVHLMLSKATVSQACLAKLDLSIQRQLARQPSVKAPLL
jgi:polar amino acid transport system substrate-binding protein